MDFEEPDEIDVEDVDDEEVKSVGEGDLSDLGSDDENGDRPVRAAHLNIDFTDLSPPQMLRKWYPCLSPVELDIVSQLGGTNLCFVQAESLLVNQILCNDQEAFETEPQFIRVVYAISRLLKQLEDSGCLIRLVFFDAIKEFFNECEESIWALREALLLHFRARDTDCVVFNHWFSEEWQTYVKEWRPSFILLSDAELPDDEEGENEEKEKDSDDTDGETSEEGETGHLGQMMRSLIASTFYLKVHVALVNGLRRQGNRILTFSLGPENHIPHLYKRVEQYFTQFLEDDEEEEEEQESIKRLVPFLKEAQDHAPYPGVRAFLLCEFAQNMLEEVEDDSEVGDKLKLLIAKTLVLMEVMMESIPLTKRSFATVNDWEFMELGQPMMAGLGNFFSFASDRLKLVNHKDVTSAGGTVDAYDFFDARLYRHIICHICKAGLETKKKKVEAEYFGLEEYATKMLDFYWDQISPDGDLSFWPINIAGLEKALAGLKPPEFEQAEKRSGKPKLHILYSHLKKDLFSHTLDALIDEVDVDQLELDVSCKNFLKNQEWNLDFFIDSVGIEQKMEKNRAQVKMEARFAKKGGVLKQSDLDFIQKFVNKSRQLAIKALNRFSSSLSGSKGLHKPIVMDYTALFEKNKQLALGDAAESKKDAKKDAKKESAKPVVPAGSKTSGVESKKDLILRKKEEEENEKKKEKDKELCKVWEPKLDNCAGMLDVKKLQAELLDMFAGYPRLNCLDHFQGFKHIRSIFQTEAGQIKVIVKFLKSIKTSLKKMHPNRLENQDEFRKFAIYLFCFVMEYAKTYALKKTASLDGKSLKAGLEVLCMLGFSETAEKIFNRWREKTVKDWEEANAAKEAAEAADAKKGKKKDDKKLAAAAKKEVKKDEKKDAKKDKKKSGDKDEEEKAAPSSADDVRAECDKHRVKDEDAALWTPDRNDVDFQMEYMGPYLERSIGSGSDPRVNFAPDAWQKDLLDIVDANESALVSAPTASGKTFICYYTMEKVLRADNEGVAVYVAPSKALVNQVHAEVYTRFGSKNYPNNSKYELMGIFLREFNSSGGYKEEGKWKYTQVLITVPHVFELLLLSPEHQDWVRRLKYVVFDEIHCIGEKEGGIQWERVMQLIPCPFLALSATVANPGAFHAWQQRLNKMKDLKKVHFIEHSERWNDLYKQVYYHDAVYRLHPFACLNERAVRRDGFAGDMTLTPRETAQLYHVVDSKIEHGKWAALNPSIFFKNTFFLSKKDTKLYETQIMATFVELMKDGIITSELFQEIIAGFQQLPKVKDDTEGEITPEPAEDDDEDAASADEEKEKVDLTRVRYGATNYLKGAKLYKLFRELDATANLPTLVFNFARTEIRTMLTRLHAYLKQKQWEKYYGDEEATYRTKQIMNERMKRFNEKHARWEAMNKLKTNDEDFDQAAAEEEPTPPIDVADEIDPEFSFHSAKAYGQGQEDIDEIIRQLAWKKTDKLLIEALRRGIGMHHEGCSTTYKNAVEVLFRRGYLQVVFATGTLALGINMPCRSTVFTGDHVELNGLMFRQMSGRAGRRGYDLLGNVIFFDVPFAKISQLVASELPFLIGELSFSPTTLLRALLQISRVVEKCDEDKLDDDKKRAAIQNIVKCTAPLFQDPFFVDRNGVDLGKQMMLYARFSVEFLMREGLVDVLGKPHDMASMVTHLFEIEPANFMLNRLFRSGALHAYLKHEEKKVVKSDRSTHLSVKLAMVLAHLLYRRRVTSTEASYTPYKSRRHHLPTKNCPVLDILPERIQHVLDEYEKDVFELYQQFVHSCSATEDIDEKKDIRLPFAEADAVPVKYPNGQNPFKKGAPFLDSYGKQLIKYKSRSPLSACSGRGDKFVSCHDIVNGVREHVVRMDYDTFPTVNTRETVNSWLIDFLLHGQLKFLAQDNRLDVSEAYRLVANVDMALSQILICLEKACPQMEKDNITPKDIVRRTMIALHADIRARKTNVGTAE